MAPVAHENTLSMDSRRRSSLFPKLVFFKGNSDRDVENGNASLSKTGILKSRRLSVENSRRVVKHLRKRLGSIKGRNGVVKDVSDKIDEESEDESNDAISGQKQATNMPFLNATITKRETVLSERQLNGMIHDEYAKKMAAFNKDFVPQKRGFLPSMAVEEHNETTSSDDSEEEEDSKRATTPGIFVDWKSDSEESSDDMSKFDFTSGRNLWSSPKNLRKNCSEKFQYRENTSDSYLWDVNSEFCKPKRKVKIFISSDPSMKRERHVALTDIFPKLSDLARSHSLALEMIDLSLDDSPHRKLTAKRYIAEAMAQSVGTAFMVFLSNERRYDQCTTLPRIIPSDIMYKLLQLLILEILACEATIQHFPQSRSSKRSDCETDSTESSTQANSADEETIDYEDQDDLDDVKKRIKSCHKAQRMLHKYYALDENNVPPHFIMKEQQKNFAHERYVMMVLQKYIRRIHNDPTVKIWKDLNLQADTTSEISQALDISADPKNNCLCFYRMGADNTEKRDREKFAKIRAKIGYNNSRIYFLNEDGMEQFKQGKDPKLLDSNSKYIEKFKFDMYGMTSLQIKRYCPVHVNSRQRLTWKRNGIQTTLQGLTQGPLDYEYLESLDLVIRSLSVVENHSHKSAHEDIIYHLRFLRNSCEGFVGREGTLRTIKKYIVSDYESVPLAVVGETGYGLSSVMSISATKVLEWRSNKSILPGIDMHKPENAPIVIYRSVGVTGKSKNIKELLFGICRQLKDILKMMHKTNDDEQISKDGSTMANIQELSARFKGLLSTITELRHEVFIFIDNMNSVHGTRGKYSLKWIPNPLPKNVKIILSFCNAPSPEGTLPDTTEEAKTMGQAYTATYKDRCAIVEIAKLRLREVYGIYQQADSAYVATVLCSFLKRNNRALTEEQMLPLLRQARQSISPLSVEMLYQISSRWNSFTLERACRNHLRGCGSNIIHIASKLFCILEINYDKNFFRSALCFLSCSRNGLTQQEIVDLIARDRRYFGKQANFLNVIAKPKPSSMSVRSPNKRVARRHALRPKAKVSPERCNSVYDINSMWYKLFEDVENLLTETYDDDTVTLKWKHSVFSEAVKATYMDTSEEVQHYHRIMSSYFSNIPEMCRCGKTHDCNQPLRWTVSARSTLNTRRLNESIHHAKQCNDLEAIKSEMLFDFEWLRAKLEATSLDFLMDEIYSVLLIKPDDNDVRLLMEALFLSYDILAHDTNQLPSQLLGRLNDIVDKDIPLAPQDPRKYPYARILLYQIRRSSLPFLMPTTTCLTSGTNIIYDALSGHEDTITAIACCTDGQRIATASKDSTIKIWDIIERRVLRTINGVGDDVRNICVCMGNYYVATIHQQNQVNVWNIQKATRVLTIRKYHPSEEISLSVALDGQLLAVVSRKSANVRVWDLDKLAFHKEISILPEKGKCPDLVVARNGQSHNILIGYKNYPEAIVVNAKRGKIARILSCEHGRITQVEISREYFIVGCRQRKMEVHELQHYYLFDGINYGLIRVLKACTEDIISNVFVNRLGSHLIGVHETAYGLWEVVVWNMESDAHRHMVESRKKILGGVCTDLQYCMTICENESVVRMHNLAAEITMHDHSRTQVKKKVDGIGRLFNMPRHEKYVVAQGMGGSPITIWNVARSKCRGEAVIIERGLLEKNDIVVVKDVMVVILSDRGMMNVEQQAFETVYVYNLLLRKYERKLHPVHINICPPDHYHLVDNDKLMATSNDRTYLTIWSIVTGDVLYDIRPTFPAYVVEDQSRRQKRRTRGNRTSSNMDERNAVAKIKTSWKACHVSHEEQRKGIFEMVLSADDGTLICSYFARHLVVFDLKNRTHKYTLTDENSLLHLHKSVVTPDGSFLLCNNYDGVNHSTYLTLWDLQEGCVTRRRQNEPKVCSAAMTDDGTRVVFITEDNFIKIWDPFRRHSHRSIAGHPRLDVSTAEGDDSQPTTIFVTMGGKRAILFANSISVWDLESESLLMVFEPDAKFSCCTVALDGQVVIIGRKESPSITTLRLPGAQRNLPNNEKNRFGEAEESDSDSSLTEESDVDAV